MLRAKLILEMAEDCIEPIQLAPTTVKLEIKNFQLLILKSRCLGPSLSRYLLNSTY